MNLDLALANDLAWQRVREYQTLPIGGANVLCPYAINFFSPNIKSLMQQAGIEEEKIGKALELYKQRQIGYGWYRGKGTPEQICSAAEELATMHGYNIARSTPEGIAEFMKLFGLGVDCSGFVFNVLDFVYSRFISEGFVSVLNWESEGKTGVNYAGATFFARRSERVEPSEVQPLDMVLYHDGGNYSHIGLILRNEQGLCVAQSNIDSLPTGVSVSNLSISNNRPDFSYTPAIGLPWNDYIEQLEFRRIMV